MIDWADQPFGQISDSELSLRLGVNQSTVSRHRNARGIPSCASVRPSCHRGIDWDSQPLGKMSDTRLAMQLGVNQATVSSARRVRGILSYAATALRVDWDDELELGILPDRVLAARHNVTVHAVWKARESRGITRPSREIDLIDWSKIPLGTVPDAMIADGLNLATSTVRKYRKKHGIKAYRPASPDWSTVPIGQESDQTIATRYGVAKSTVARARQLRGVPACGRKKAA